MTKNIFITEFDKNNPYAFRLTKEGYDELQRNGNKILKTLYDLFNDENLSYNDIIVRSYDYLETIIPDFFEAFCNIYFKGCLIDSRINTISISEKERYEIKIQNAQTLDYRHYFYNKNTSPILFIDSSYDPKIRTICPIGIISVKVLMGMIANIINNSYEDIFGFQSFVFDNLLSFKYGIMF